MKIPYVLFKRFLHKYPNRRPQQSIPVKKLNLDDLLNSKQPKVVWFGHSTAFMQIGGKTILCDPIFSNLFWFFSIFTGKRFTEQLPLVPQEFPEIDVVLLSHDHYDHMDYHSIMAIKDKVHRFCVPHGVGTWLRRWGIANEKITELSYGETLCDAELTFTCTPNQHFSGRGLFDRNKTLWCSWVITSKKVNVFFSGDGAYGPHFKEIGDQYGPFDLTLMECGQAIEFSRQIHMTPEKVVRAQIDLQGQLMLPIHWGMFSQSNTEWTHQVERLLREAEMRTIKVATPIIGEIVTIGAEKYPCASWWKELI
ncbi:MBL fold metallo-hydrolase [Pelosinus sp. sgz500959]|uniref:MBL fold metallo-hydrolase n=1 Tax=Pelosinus sp. sgz500959 TaxID=3242472 RepID=UPI003672EF1C